MASSRSSDGPRPVKSLRVLHVIGGLQTGGAEALLFRLATRPSDVEHEVISLIGPAWYSGRLEEKGVKVHHLHVASVTSAVAAIFKLDRLIQESRADVIQGWMYSSNLLAALSGQRHRIPVVWGIHTSTMEGIGLRSRAAASIGGRLSRWLPAFVINCSSRSAELHAKMGYSAASGAVIHNGYDPDAFFPDDAARLAARTALGIAPDMFLIGNIARWNEKKDLPNLARGLRAAMKLGLDFRCILVGRHLDPGNSELMQVLDETGTRDRVEALGERADIQDLTRAMDLHVLASCGGEAFPNVVAESMLSGTPNVVTDVGDAAMMVGDSGWVVPPRDPDALAGAIIQGHAEWKDDPGCWTSRRGEARQRIADNFTFEKMASAYEDAWRKAAAGKRRG